MNDDSYLPGSDCYDGHCIDCGKRTHTTYDEICEDCLKDKPVKCPACFDFVHPDHMTELGLCIVCSEIDLTPLFDEIIDELKSEMK